MQSNPFWNQLSEHNGYKRDANYDDYESERVCVWSKCRNTCQQLTQWCGQPRTTHRADKYTHKSNANLNGSKEQIGILDELQDSVRPPVTLVDSLLQTCLA